MGNAYYSHDEKEVWKSVPFFEGLYEVSDQGRVRSLDREITSRTGKRWTLKGKILSLRGHQGGYLKVNLHKSGEKHTRLVHQLVLETFKGSAPPEMESLHVNGVPGDNRLENLRWGTSRENGLDVVRHGRHVGKLKTHCKQGHPFDEINTYRKPSGKRSCRACRNEGARRSRKQAKLDYQPV